MAKVGRPKNPPSPKELLKSIIPLEDLFSKEEIKLYTSYVDHYLNDFKGQDLSASDLDDIASLSSNKVMEIRLIKHSKDSATKQTSVATAIEKLHKHNETLKTSLSTRRKDRINPNEYKGFSIVDLAIAFDDERKAKVNRKAAALKAEMEEAAAAITNYGNKDDIDGVQEDDKDE